jgi:hypothetical protein
LNRVGFRAVKFSARMDPLANNSSESLTGASDNGRWTYEGIADLRVWKIIIQQSNFHYPPRHVLKHQSVLPIFCLTVVVLSILPNYHLLLS